MTTATPATSSHQDLLAFRENVAAAARMAVESCCQDWPRLRDAIVLLLDTDLSQASIYRLLPRALAPGRPEVAQLVCVISRVWWTGAETVDDITDGQVTYGLTTAEATIAGTACITLVPQLILTENVEDPQLRQSLVNELTSASLQAAEGQLDELAEAGQGQMWRQTMRSYVGKSGAAYGRDLAMTAILTGEAVGQLSRWRAFGKLFGVLRQMVNDNSALSTPDNEDFRNGTRTLLLATAVDEAGLGTLPALARHDAGAQPKLLAALTSPEVAAVYNGRVHMIRAKLSALLAALAPAPGSADLIRLMIDTSAHAALVGTVEDSDGRR